MAETKRAISREGETMAMDEHDSARLCLRQRWELASVLNFFHIFEPLIKSESGLTAEEIESALISPNNDLARLHTALLKGIPPVIKNSKEPNAWITATSKKLAPWWRWVAEGENPLKADHGKEITKYKELDPVTRLLILKALCELRGEQEDVLRFITDELKKGTPISTFRKVRIGGDGNKIIYWYEEDPVIGYRLYREEMIVEYKQKWKGKGRLTEPTISFKWETVATNLDEFQNISEKFLSSKVTWETAIGGILKIEILPLVDKFQKKKERAVKRKQREAFMLESFRNSIRTSTTRACRQARPVSYTYDDYDRCIREAIKLSENQREDDLQVDFTKQTEQCKSSTGPVHLPNNDSNNHNSGSDEKHTTKRETNPNPNLKLGLRRSKRNAPPNSQGTPEAKKRLRQRPVLNREYVADSLSESDEKNPNYEPDKAARVSDSESEDEISDFSEETN